MSIRVRTQQLLRDLNAKASMTLMSAGATVDKKTAEASFDPFLRSVWAAETGGGKQPIAREKLQAAFEAAAAKAVGAVAGQGRSAGWVSRDEATLLPDGLREAWVATRARTEDKVAYAQAVHDPFPLGKVEPELVFDRHLAMAHKRVARELFEVSGLLDRLPALESAVKAAKGKLTVGDVTIHAAQGKDEFVLDGQRYWSYGAASTLVFQRGDVAVGVGWVNDHGGLTEPKLRMLRFGVADHEREPRASTSYDPPGSSLEDLLSKLALKTGHSAFATPKLSEDEQLFKRFASVDIAGLEVVALGALRASGADPALEKQVQQAAARAYKKDAAVIPELAARADFLGLYTKLAEHVKAHGELVLGDMDGTVKIADTFERAHYGSDDDDATVTLVSGKGPLLIVDNSFGGLGHAIPLAALEQGELDVYLAQRSTPRGRLHRAADGTSQAVPEPNMAQRLAADLLEFLPASLEG